MLIITYCICGDRLGAVSYVCGDGLVITLVKKLY